MCGHVGYISSFVNGMGNTDTKIFTQALWVDILRGADGTGVCAISKEAGATVYKEASDAGEFLSDKEVRTFLEKQTGLVALLGHNRKATAGKVKDENSHPFVYDDRYVFFHNGTLSNHAAFGTDEVDSESFGRHICAAEGDIEKLSDVFNKAYGAWACVWYDSVKHKVYFKRNSQRTFFIGHLLNGDVIYGSEEWIITGVATRNNQKIKEIKPLEEWKLYSIDLNHRNVLKIESEVIPKKAIPTTVMKVVGTHTTATKFLTRKEAAKVAQKLKKEGNCCVTIKEMIPAVADGVVEDSHLYNYHVIAESALFEGCVFRFLVKDLFPYEAQLAENTVVWGDIDDHEYRAGHLDVYLKNVDLNNAYQTC